MFFSLQFGNVALGWKFAEWAKANGISITGTKIDNLTIVKSEGNNILEDKKDGVKIVVKIPETIKTLDDGNLLNGQIVNIKIPEEKGKEDKKENDCFNKSRVKVALVPEEFFNFE